MNIEAQRFESFKVLRNLTMACSYSLTESSALYWNMHIEACFRAFWNMIGEDYAKMEARWALRDTKATVRQLVILEEFVRLAQVNEFVERDGIWLRDVVLPRIRKLRSRITAALHKENERGLRKSK